MSFRVRDTTSHAFVKAAIDSTSVPEPKKIKKKKTNKQPESETPNKLKKSSGGFQVKQDFTNQSDFF